MNKIKSILFSSLVLTVVFFGQGQTVNAACCSTNCSTVESSCSPDNWYSSINCSEIPSCSSGTASSSATATTAYADGWNVNELSVYGLPEASVYDIVTNFLYWLLGILGIAGVIGFALSGIMYLLSAGNDDMTGSAKKAMTASILGVIIGLSGLVIIRAIDWALNGFSFF